MATITSQRPWEPSKSSPGSSPQPRGQLPGQLPSISALTSNLPDNGSSSLPSPASTRERDSGGWSSQAHSTRSSAYSTTTSSYPMSSATNSYYMSPSNRISNLSASSTHGPSHASADYSVPPTSAGPLSSPGFAPSQHSSLLPSLNQHHDPNRQSITSQASQQSQEGFPKQESRRSSIGSQVNQGMTSLQINGATSPYSNSVNHSSASLAQNLSRERGIPGSGGLRTSRSSAQLPTSPPLSEQRPAAVFTPRIAPVIGRNPRSDVYNADEPVPGQAYAFPDAPDLEPGALPPKNNSSIRHTNSSDGSSKPPFGRRDSGHTSIASSIDTGRLPSGQHRLEDASMPGTHHHSLQQHQMSDLQEDEAMTPEESSQPYSRTPALRVSHKMAERKRRSEMKDLFENLRSQIPTNQGSKSSKWEILTKASEYIRQLETSNQGASQADKQLRLAMHDVNETRRDNDKLRNDNQQLLQELQRMRSAPTPQPQAQQAPPPQSAAYPSSYNPPPPPPPPQMHDPGRSLPPLHSTVNNSGSMQGVEYR